ncbi:MAG: hypothetical protein LBV02_07420 [Bacteroidales bacterium]|jgi:hypothetical protein|nr:hypothetical protein [Bacteroidales bacterium]
MTSLLLIDNPVNLQDWKATVRHFSACRGAVKKLNGHLFKIIKRQKKDQKTIFTIRFIPVPSIFDIDSPLLSAIPASYLIDTVCELLEINLKSAIQIQWVSGVKNHLFINPFEENDYQIVIAEQDEEHQNGHSCFSAHVKKQKTVFFEAFFSVSI